MPQDLIYLAVAESGFQPRAVNRRSARRRHVAVHAHGNYGLTRNGYVDERFDPEKSTRAYARYMKYLYDQLGDWYLAMAGYDWGTGNVQRAVQKTGYADFWELYKRNNLPGETKNYVPEILAAIIIANHPTQYGFDDITLDPPVLTDTVTINYSVDLRLVSDLVGAPVDELVALIPACCVMDSARHAVRPAPARRHRRALRAADRGNSREQRNSWRYHPWLPDDTLASVARTYHVQASELAEATSCTRTTSWKALRLWSCLLRRPPRLGAHRALHDPPGRYAGLRRRSLRRLAHPVAALEQLPPPGIKVDAGRRLHVAEPVRVSAAAAAPPGSAAEQSSARKLASTSAPSHKAQLLPRDEAVRTPQSRRHTGTRKCKAHPGHESHSSQSRKKHLIDPPSHRKTNAPRDLVSCFDSFYVQGIVRMTPHAGDDYLCTAKIQIPRAAAVRWRQSDGRSDQDVRDE